MKKQMTLAMMFSIVIFASDMPQMECNKKIHVFLDSMVQQDHEGWTFKSKDELAARLNMLKEEIGNDNIRLVYELICYKSQAKGMAEGMLPAMIFNTIVIPKEDIFWGIMPYLNCCDVKKSKIAYETLLLLEDVKVFQKSFLFYEEMLKKYDKKIPLSLIDYMYSKSPELALSTMSNVYMTKESAAELMRQIKTTPDWKTLSRYSDKNVSVDPQILLSLSKRPEWWIQLYVAKRIWKSALPFPPEILKNLEQSQHPLVVQAVATMIEKNKHDVSK